MRFIHVTLRIRPDKAETYESTFFELQRLVRENEPGCRMFELCKDPDEPFAYHVLEAYDDQDAVDAHAGTEYYSRTANIFIACLAGDHMETIKAKGLTGRYMYSVVENIQFERLDSIQIK